MKSHLLLVVSVLLTCLVGGLSPVSAQGGPGRDRISLNVGTNNLGPVAITVQGNAPSAQSYPARPLRSIVLSYQGKSLVIPPDALRVAGPVNIDSVSLRDVPGKAVAVLFNAPNRRDASSSRMSTVEFIVARDRLGMVRIATPYARTGKPGAVTRELQIFDFIPQR